MFTKLTAVKAIAAKMMSTRTTAKKVLVTVLGAASLAIPLAAVGAGAAEAGVPNYDHVVSVTATQHLYWDRNWPNPNMSIWKSGSDTHEFFSSYAYPGNDSYFYNAAVIDYATQESMMAQVSYKEIPNSGGRIAVTFKNNLSYGSYIFNQTKASFSINTNGTAYYTLITADGDGSWGETDIVVHNTVK